MEMVVLQAAGALVFLVGTIILGRRFRRDGTRESAERLSRRSHALFWGGLVFPELLGILYPGLTAFDGLLGLPSLPRSPALVAIGSALLIAGAYLLVASNVALKTRGAGYAAFRLTRRLVATSVYEFVRNPMSLGTYCAYAGISLLAGSTYLLLGTVAVVVPVHVFNLLYFEEPELSARHGAAYGEYLRRVPFLVPLSRGSG